MAGFDRAMFKKIAGVFAPERKRLLCCALCGSPDPADCGLCEACAAMMPEAPAKRSAPGIDGVRAAFAYEEPARTLILRFKFKNERYLAALFAYYMAALDDFPKEAVLVPVPLHEKRKKLRGFSQTGELCRELSRLTGRGTAFNILQRNRDTPPQTGLPFSERQENLKGAFSAGGAEGLSAILVDDVITSGATLAECARALRETGAGQVFALCACSAEKD